MGRETIHIDAWKKQAEEKFGTDPKNWKFKCPSCAETQTLQDFIDAKIDSPDGKFYFSCIGRWVKGRGCDWTLGGLLQIHKTEVIDQDGNNVPVFEFAD